MTSATMVRPGLHVASARSLCLGDSRTTLLKPRRPFAPRPVLEDPARRRKSEVSLTDNSLELLRRYRRRGPPVRRARVVTSSTRLSRWLSVNGHG